MTEHPLTRGWSSVIVGALLLACAVSAQSKDESIEIMDCDRHAIAEKDVPAVTMPLCSEEPRSVAR